MGVKVRVNRRKLYLDIYPSGQRKGESPGLTLTSDEQQNLSGKGEDG